jgi:hypothetical protein
MYLYALESRSTAILPTKILKQTSHNLVSHGRPESPKLTSYPITCISTLTDHCLKVPFCESYPRKVSRICTLCDTSASQVSPHSWHTTCNRLPCCCPNQTIPSHESIKCLDPLPIPPKISADRRTILGLRLVPSFHSMRGCGTGKGPHRNPNLAAYNEMRDT